MSDWIEELRQERIKKNSKKGSWTPEGFKGRHPLGQAIEEGADLLNYLEMAQFMGYITEGFRYRICLGIKDTLNKLHKIWKIYGK